MKPTTSPLVILGPVDQFPAEGYEPDRQEASSLGLYADALAGSEIGFELSEEGIVPSRTLLNGDLFQSFTLGETAEDDLVPGDEAWRIDFTAMLGGRVGFDDFSDAAEPSDYVRRFVELAGKALDQDPELAFEGRHFPVVRWQQREGSDSPGAQVQLLGILRATDEQFEEFCATAGEGVELIHEESEIEGRGIREVAMTLAVFGISLAATPKAEAGLFKKLVENHRENKAEREAEKTAVKKAEAVVQHKQRTGWVDTHQDAKIDKGLLEKADTGGVDRRIVVDITKQRAYLLIDGEIAIDTAVSTARTGKYTPRGEFTITERIRSGKHSTIYGCEMPCWMRLGTSAYGLHVGDLPGRPASAGCVRLPYTVAPVIFDHVNSGTPVKIVDAWTPQEESAPHPMLAQVD
ncbi:MAG: L,D-transpeptidase [Verrucomicrobiae bacterium]|nr:L,D-transpeptidase [Verrucomicrobiae bacterium]